VEKDFSYVGGFYPMSCEVIQTDQAPAAIGPYSQGIKAGGWLFVSGQIALKPGSVELVSEDFADQARQALNNMQNILKAAGYGLSDVAAVDVFVTDMGQFSVFNTIYEEYFSNHKPARAVVEVRGLPKGAKVEVKCTAFRSF
jgi:2-iminobutanoate/2-iminopropanoate deaminase